jgi:NlpC/P60 family
VSKVDDVIAWAQLELGKPYVYGDEGPNTFDCSGLMQFIFAKVGVRLPRTAHEQQRWAAPVTSPMPGDLVFWGDPAYHVALYIGGGKIIAAPQPGERVQIQPVWGQPAGYGRVPGVGSLAAPLVGVLTGVGGVVSDGVSAVLGGARGLVLEALAVVLGLTLVGVGIYRAVVAPRARQIAATAQEVLA